jgi:adenosylmethionine-8-amino-7-oxononanoate aminotransferase
MTAMPAFDETPFTVARAQGVRVWDDHGRRYLDAMSGLWNVACGYGEPRIADAVRDQLLRLSYGTLFRRGSEPAAELAERLLDIAPAPYHRVFYSCSGGAAVDTAMKLARRWQRLAGRRGRHLVVGLAGSYHGTMYGGMTVSGQDLDQDEYGADTAGVRHVPVNDVAALERLFAADGGRIAAVAVEPVLGNGCIVAEHAYLDRLGQLCAASDVVTVVDEVATGFGRTGRMFASEGFPFAPDLLLLSKAVTSGYLPLAATLVSERVATAFDRAAVVFSHGETQSGSAPACAAALATLALFEDDDLVRRAAAAGKLLAAELDELAGHRLVTGHAGVGLMRAVSVRRGDGGLPDAGDVTRLVARVRREGALVQPGPDGVELFPPLVITSEEIAELVGCLRRALDGSEL